VQFYPVAFLYSWILACKILHIILKPLAFNFPLTEHFNNILHHLIGHNFAIRNGQMFSRFHAVTRPNLVRIHETVYSDIYNDSVGRQKSIFHNLHWETLEPNERHSDIQNHSDITSIFAIKHPDVSLKNQAETRGMLGRSN
jgi:hypothetical protein